MYWTPENTSAVPSYSSICINTFAGLGSLVGLNVGGDTVVMQRFGREFALAGSTKGCKVTSLLCAAETHVLHL